MIDCGHCGKNCSCVGMCRCAQTREELGERVTVEKGNKYCEYLRGLREGKAVELVPLDAAAVEYVEAVLQGLPGVQDVALSKDKKSVFASSKDRSSVSMVQGFAERDTMEVEMAASPKRHDEFVLTGASCKSCTSNISKKLRKEPSKVSACCFDINKDGESSMRTYSEPHVSTPRLQAEVASRTALAADKFGVAMQTTRGDWETSVFVKDSNLPPEVVTIDGVSEAKMLKHSASCNLLNLSLVPSCDISKVRHAVVAALKQQNLLVDPYAECKFCGPSCCCTSVDCSCKHEQEGAFGEMIQVYGEDERYCTDLKAVTEGQYVEIVPTSAEVLEGVYEVLNGMDGVDTVVLSKERESVFVGSQNIPKVIRALHEKEKGAMTLRPQRRDEFRLTGATCKSCTANIGRKFKNADALEAWSFDIENERLDVFSYVGTPESEVQVEVASKVLQAGEKFGVARKVPWEPRLSDRRAMLTTSIVVKGADEHAQYPEWSMINGVTTGEVVPCPNTEYEVVNIGMLEGTSPSAVRHAVSRALAENKIEIASPSADWKGKAAKVEPNAPDYEDADHAVDVNKLLSEQQVFEFIVGGMRCVSCATKIESHFADVPGVARCNVNAATSITRVTASPSVLDADAVQKHIASLGFTAELLQSAGAAGFVFAAPPGDTDIALKTLQAMETVESAALVDDSKLLVKVAPGVMAIDIEKEAKEQGVHLERDKSSRNDKLLSALKREDAIAESKRGFIESAIPTVPLIVLHMILESFAGVAPMRDVKIYNSLTLEPLVEWTLCTYVLLRCGAPFYKGAWAALRNGSANMAVLVCIGVTTAYIASIVMSVIAIFSEHMEPELHFATAAALLCFMLLGQYLESNAKAMTSEALVSLMELQPTDATIIRKDRKTGEVLGTEIVDTEELVRGVVCRVAAGVRVPCDGHVVSGSGDVDESMVTGEPMPVHKRIGDEVVGGTIVMDGAVDVEVDHCGSETMLSQILQIVLEAQNSKAPIQKYADMISAVFVPVIVLISIIVFLVWLSLGLADVWGDDFTDESDGVFASQFFIATVIIACPCAMGLATPTAVMVGTGLGAKAGILIKGGEALEGAAKPKAVLFDKTGTLTMGKPSVTEYLWFAEKDKPLEEKVVKMVAAAESSSDHPIAKAIVKHCDRGALPVPEDFENIPGKGIRCSLEGSVLTIGKPKYILETTHLTAVVEERIAEIQSEGKTVVVAAYDGEARCLFGISDVIRKESKEVIAALHKRGIDVHMVTGDNTRTAKHVAGILGIPENRVNSEILPAGKAMVVKGLQEDLNEKIFFVGDGINDTPALAQADVGVAIGGGTNVAVESADIVLIKDDLWGVLHSIQIAAATTSKIKWNFVWAFGYNVCAIPIAAGVLYPAFHLQLPPIIAGIAMVASSLTVLASSLLLKTFKPTCS